MMQDRLESLFKAYSPMVFRVCLRYVGQREEAEDLTQEVFLKVDRSLTGFKGGSATSTWIYRIAANACLDHLRAAKRHCELDMRYVDDLVVRNLNPEGDRELARIDLERILGKFSAEVREFLFLTQLEGMTYDQAASVTGKSAAAIAKSVSRFWKQASGIRGDREARAASQEKSGRAV